MTSREAEWLKSNFGPLMELINTVSDEPVDQDAAEGLAAMMSFAQTTTNVPILASPVASPDFRFVAQLKRAALRVYAHEVEGEATLLAKVRRKLTHGEQHAVFEFFAGQSALPPQLRRELEDALKADETFADMFVTAPAVVITPVALYR